MKSYAIDVPAFVTVRFKARDEQHAQEIAKGLLMMGHEFGWDDQQTEVDGVTISPAITLYPEGIEGDAFRPTRIMEEDIFDEDEAADYIEKVTA